VTRIRRNLLGILALALLLLVWARFSFHLVQQALVQVGWGLIPLSLLGLVWAVWDVLCLAQLMNPPLSWMRLLWIEWSSDGLSRLIPSAGLGGEPFRYRHLRPMHPEPAKLVLVYRVIHAISGLMATSVTASLCYAWHYSPEYAWGKLAILSGAAALVGWAGLLWRRPFAGLMLLRSLFFKVVSRFFQVSEVVVLLFLLGASVTPQRILMLQAYLAASASLFAFVPGGLGVQEYALLRAAVDSGLGDAIGFQVGLLRRCRQLMFAGWGLLAASWLEASVASEKALTAREHGAPEREPDDHPGSE